MFYQCVAQSWPIGLICSLCVDHARLLHLSIRIIPACWWHPHSGANNRKVWIAGTVRSLMLRVVLISVSLHSFALTPTTVPWKNHLQVSGHILKPRIAHHLSYRSSHCLFTDFFLKWILIEYTLYLGYWFLDNEAAGAQWISPMSWSEVETLFFLNDLSPGLTTFHSQNCHSWNYLGTLKSRWER